MQRILIALLAILILSIAPVSALTYDDMARYPDKYKGEPVILTGKVTGVIYDGEFWAIHLQTKKTTYGSYSGNDVYVIFKGSPTNGRILEDDIVQVSGWYGGPYDYETVLGAYRSVPGIRGDTYLVNPLHTQF